MAKFDIIPTTHPAEVPSLKSHLSTSSILNDQLAMFPGHDRSSTLAHLSLQLGQSSLELLDVARLKIGSLVI